MTGDTRPAGPTRRDKIIRRTRVGLTLALVVAAMLWAASRPEGPAITLGLAVVMTLWSIVEVQRMGLFTATYGAPAAAVACIVGAVLFGRAFLTESGEAAEMFGSGGDPGHLWAAIGVALAGGFVAGLIALLPALLRRGGESSVVPGEAPGGESGDGPGGPGPASTPTPHWLLLVVVALPLLGLVPIRAYGGIAGLSGFLVLAKVGDVAGYYFGSLMGRRHPFPNISPGKTVAGCVASLIFGTAFGGIFVLTGVLEGARFGVLSGLVLGAIINILAQAGDLLESALKRRAKVKDSGTTFGPSGGMLDLVDSLLLSAPVVALLWPVLFHWPV